MAPPGTGTLVNALAILLGSGLGWALGRRLPERISQTLLQAMGLLVLVLGMQMALTLSSAAQAVTVLLALIGELGWGNGAISRLPLSGWDKP